MLGTLIGVLQEITGVSFASFDYTTKATGEKSRYQIILGASIENLYAKDIEKLTKVVGLLKGIKALPHTILAAEELLASRLESLEKGIGNNSAYTQADTYVHLNHLPGVKIHAETGKLYINGLVESKKVLEEGSPRKKVNSAPKTIAKRRIERTLASGRFRTLALDNVSGARVRGNVLELVTT